jgi:DNA-binding NarL/FixJ family response regulator
MEMLADLRYLEVLERANGDGSARAATGRIMSHGENQTGRNEGRPERPESGSAPSHTDETAPMNVLIADDHSVVRSGLKHLLADLADDLNVIEANTFDSAFAACTAAPKPELAIIDLNMPGLEDLDELERLVRSIAPVPVVAFSMDETPERMRAVLARGARAYIPKSTDDAVVIGVLRLVLAGGIYVPPVLGLEPEQGAGGGLHWEGAAERLAGLTRRQQEVLALLAEGLSNMDISRRLDLNLSTVKSHVTAILRALDVDNRTQAVLALQSTREEHGD